MMDAITGDVAGWAFIGILALALIGKVMITRFAQESTTTVKARAEYDIVKRLHDELDRLAKQNAILSQRLNELQLLVPDLRKEIGRLWVENEALKGQVSILRDRVSSMHEMASRCPIEDPSCLGTIKLIQDRARDGEEG